MTRFRRRLRLPRASVALALLPAAACPLAACGSSHPASAPANTVPTSSPHSLSVTPAHPGTRAEVAFGFTARMRSGIQGREVITDSLSVTGTGARGCVAVREVAAPAVAKGARATVRLGPPQLGGPWCPGRYSARVIELARAHCTGSTPCPQYIREVAVIARGTFDVARG